MTDRREQIDRLLADAEREAYARGWRDAIAHLQARAAEIPNGESAADIAQAESTVAETDRRRGRPAKAITIVRDIIFAEGGLKGVEIVRAAERNGTPVLERTVRSCLRRLKEHRLIWQRDGRWYPRRRDKPETGNGEALIAPPH